MNRLVALTAFIYLAGTGWALAQIKPAALPTPAHSTFSTGSPQSGFAQPTSQGNGIANKTISHGSMQGPNMHAVNLIIRQQMRQIPKDLKSGKITKAQAQAAWENLRNVRKQELEYFKQNGQKEITVTQKSQLTATLNQNVSGI
jgi:hypothetical protein